MSRYKDKIYELVHNMYDTLNHVHPSNRRAVDEYLYHSSFWRIELLLRSTRSVNPKILSDPDLSRSTESYAKTEEDRLDTSLQDVAYELDTPATVSLVTGVGRIERVSRLRVQNDIVLMSRLSMFSPSSTFCSDAT